MNWVMGVKSQENEGVVRKEGKELPSGTVARVNAANTHAISFPFKNKLALKDN